MGIKVQRTRCFLDIGISNVLGKTETSDAFTQLLLYYVVISQIKYYKCHQLVLYRLFFVETILERC